MPKILVDCHVLPASLARLKALPETTIHVIPQPEEAECRPLSKELIRDVEILLCTIPPKNIDEMKKLRWLQVTSAGYGQLSGLNLVKRGIRAANGRGNFDVPIAEWNLAMMVNLTRDFRQMIRNQEARIWDRSAQFQREIRGLTVGIWGYGGIGRETARLAKAMGMTVKVLSREGVKSVHNVYCVPGTGDPEGKLPDKVFLRGQETEFLSDLDFLILAMPLNSSTEGLIGERELRALPRTAYLLNPARGPLVKEQPLLQALRGGWIAGAALDTHYHYPMPPEHPLWMMANVILTPHISGSGLSPHFLSRTWGIFAENVERDLRKLPLLNELTIRQLEAC